MTNTCERFFIQPFRADLPQLLRRLKNMSGAATVPVEAPESRDVIRWKRDAEIAAAAEEVGRKLLAVALNRVMDACDRDAPSGFNPRRNPALKLALEESRRAGVPDSALKRALQYAEQGYETMPLGKMKEEEEAATPILSIPDEFMEAALTGNSFVLQDGRSADAETMWDEMAEAIWSCGAPTLSFRRENLAGRALQGDASGAFVFLAGADAPSVAFDPSGMKLDDIVRATRKLVETLDAEAEGDFRPVLLNIQNATPDVAALISGVAHWVSAEAASTRGAFPAYDPAFLKNLREKIALTKLHGEGEIVEAARAAWARAFEIAQAHGFRNAHLTGMTAEMTLDLQAEAEPFLSGGVAQTIVLPNAATVDDVRRTMQRAWELGLKRVRIYRENCALSQPVFWEQEEEQCQPLKVSKTA